MTKIMVIEDEDNLQTILQYNLSQQGYEVASVMDGKKALPEIQKEMPDLILLDWMLPHMSGVEICKRVRQNQSLKHIPILMLTARGDVSDKVSGLSVGTDDYMTKPFSLDELHARIKALLRRAQPKPMKAPITLGSLQIDSAKKQVIRNGEIIHLGPTEWRLLMALASCPEKVFSRQELLKQVWGDAIHGEERTLDVHIKRLRKALCAKGQADVIRTVRSAGYALMKN